jgi:uncharacterized protein (DUF1778 family)
MEAQTAATKTERLTVLLSREEKQSLEERARAADLSVGEFVRRASRSYDPELDYETLEAVVTAWNDNLRHMRETLAASSARHEAFRAEMEELRRSRRGAC